MPLRKEENRHQSEVGRPRVIVCGSRHFADGLYLAAKLDFYTQLLKDPIIVVGGDKRTNYTQPGADYLAYHWALRQRHLVKVFHPEWDTYGAAAGPRRNQEMADYAVAQRPGYMPAYCIAFHDGSSPGTADMITRAKKARIKVVTINILTGEVDVWPDKRG